MKTLLLTGGTGFIGRNLRESFLKDSYELEAPSRDELDIADTDSVDDYFRTHQFDVILHAAAKPGHRNAPDPTRLFYTNMRMFENLVRHSDRYGKFINFGSGAVYDTSVNNAGVTEEQIFFNIGKDEHSFCKYVMAKRIENLLGFVDLNIFGIFGKYEDYAIRFISHSICRSLFGLPVTMRQNRRFSYLDVNDLPKILEFFIENDVQYQSYNIVPDNFVELQWLAEYIAVQRGVDVQIADGGYGLDYYGSNARLKEEFPQIVFTDIFKSIDELFDYYTSIKDTISFDAIFEDR